MRAVLRNPLVRLGLRLWWLPVLVAVAAAFYPGIGGGLPWLLAGIAAFAGLLLGLVGVPVVHGLAVAGRERRRHAAAQHRFLCTACLELSDFCFACGACSKEIEALIVHTAGKYVNRCPHCEQVVEMTPAGVHALCSACSAVGDRTLSHERALRIVGTLLAEDFELLVHQRGGERGEAGGLRWLRVDDGQCFTYVLSLDDLNSRSQSLVVHHGARAVETLWLSDAEPLRLGQALDGFLARAELSDAQLASITAWVAADRLDPAASRLLSARLGSVKYAVPAGEFLPGVAPGVANEVAEAVVRGGAAAEETVALPLAELGKGGVR